MQISNFSVNNQSFKARTTIKDDGRILNKKDKEDLIRIGESIGTDRDTISIFLGDLKQSQVVRDVAGYDCVISSDFKTPTKWVRTTEEYTVPFFVKGDFVSMNNPKSFIVRQLEKIAANIR